jgi:hypothetical protein
MDEVDLQQFGPKMSALTEKQRRYVLAMLSDPLGNPTGWARAAGYADGGPKSALIRKTAHYLAHDDRISEAAQEEARRHLDTIGPVLGIGVMMQIARTKGHKKQLDAAMALADRTGFHAKSEHKVSVEHRDRTGAALEARLRSAAALLGLDPAVLLGVNAAPKLIEGEVVDAGGPAEV